MIEAATKLRQADAVDHLARLGARLLRCVKSLSYDGPARTPDSDAALIEALGWFAGWQAGRRYLTTAEGSEASAHARHRQACRTHGTGS